MRRLKFSARRVRVGERDDLVIRARLRLSGPGERPLFPTVLGGPRPRTVLLEALRKGNEVAHEQLEAMRTAGR